MNDFLRQHISKGPFKCVFSGDNITRAVRNEGGLICKLIKPIRFPGQDERYEQELTEAHANQELIAEAFTVFSRTNKTPGELEEELRWIPVTEKLPDDFDQYGQTSYYQVWISNPHFEGHHCWVAWFQKSPFGDAYNRWQGIEPNVSHGNDQPIVTHYRRILPPTA